MAERWQASRVRVQRLAGRARPTTPDLTITGVKCFIFSIQEGMFFSPQLTHVVCIPHFSYGSPAKNYYATAILFWTTNLSGCCFIISRQLDLT